MGLFDRFLALRDRPTGVVGWLGLNQFRSLTASQALRNMLSGQGTASGVSITERSSLQSLTVATAVNILSESFSQLPVKLFKRMPNGGRQVAADHPLYRVLHDQANEETTAVEWRRQAMVDVALFGNHYSEISFNFFGQCIGLFRMSPDQTKLRRARDGKLYYDTKVYKNNAWESHTLAADDVLHVKWMSLDGYTGLSPIACAREGVALDIAYEQFSARFFANDASPSFVLSTDAKLTAAQVEELDTAWKAKHQGVQEAHKVAILHSGLQPKTVTIPAKEAQFLESRNYGRNAIFGLYRVPAHLASDVTKTTTWGSGINAMTQGFVTYTLGGPMANFSAAFTMKLLGPRDRLNYYAEFITDAILRTDETTRFQNYEVALRNKFLTVNEVRELENRDPVAWGDSFDDGDPTPSDNGPTRQRAIRAHRHTLADAVDRILRREQSDVSRGVEKLLSRSASPAEQARWLTEFYAEHKSFTQTQIRPALRAIADAVKADIERELGREINTQLVTVGEEAFAHRLNEATAGEVRKAVVGGPTAAKVNAVLGRKGDTVAERELLRMGNYFARTFYQAAGVEMRWVGKCCADCSSLDGKAIAATGQFRDKVSHPPLHDGCDCIVVAATGSVSVSRATTARAEPGQKLRIVVGQQDTDAVSDGMGKMADAIMALASRENPAPIVNVAGAQVTVEPTPIQVTVPVPSVTVNTEEPSKRIAKVIRNPRTGQITAVETETKNE